MPSPVYFRGRCKFCGVQTRVRVWYWHGRAVNDCGRHEAEKKRKQYDAKHAAGLCVWSGCNKKRICGKSMCKGHLTDNRVAKAQRSKLQPKVKHVVDSDPMDS